MTSFFTNYKEKAQNTIISSAKKEFIKKQPKQTAQTNTQQE